MQLEERHMKAIGLLHLGWIITGLGLIGLYLPTMTLLMESWQTDPNYSHGWLVPVIAGWLAWRVSRRIKLADAQPWLGSAEMLAGLILHLTAQVTPWPLLDFAGLVLLLRGLAIYLGGSATARHYMVPIFFLFFMFPLPVTWTSSIAVWLQDAVSQISAGLLSLFWVIYQRGHTLYLAGIEQPLLVAEECSGLRQIVAFLALAFLLAHLSQLNRFKGTLLVLSALPCALLANVARVVLMAMGIRWFGPSIFTGWMHDLPALFTLPVGLLLFLFVSRWLIGSKSNDTAVDQVTAERESVLPAPARHLSWTPICAFFLLAHGVQWALIEHVRQADELVYSNLEKPLSEFPFQFTKDNVSLSGKDNVLSNQYAAKLSFADAYLHRTYRSSNQGLTFGLYASYSKQGLDREHHPEVCVRDAGGGTEDRSYHRLIPLGPEGAAAERFRYRIGGGRTLTIYYWHYTFPWTAEPGAFTWIQLLHQRQRQRPPSLTVQVTTEMMGPATDLLEEHWLPLLHQAWLAHLPMGARMGTDRLPIRWLGP